jgi:hypothetical protein
MNLNSINTLETPDIDNDPANASSMSSNHIKNEVPKKEFNKVHKVLPRQSIDLADTINNFNRLISYSTLQDKNSKIEGARNSTKSDGKV